MSFLESVLRGMFLEESQMAWLLVWLLVGYSFGVDVWWRLVRCRLQSTKPCNISKGVSSLTGNRALEKGYEVHSFGETVKVSEHH